MVTAQPIFSLMFVAEGLLLLTWTCPPSPVSRQVPYVRPASDFVPPIGPVVHTLIVLYRDMFDECVHLLVRCSHVLPLILIDDMTRDLLTDRGPTSMP